MALNDIFARVARGGRNQRGRRRRSNRPRGEGRGFIDTIRAAIGRPERARRGGRLRGR